jgi:putative transposase
VAIILDAWSRRVVGYAIGGSIDALLALAALKVAIERRRPATRMHSSFGRRIAIRLVSIKHCWRPMIGRLDEPARKNAGSSPG